MPLCRPLLNHEKNTLYLLLGSFTALAALSGVTWYYIANLTPMPPQEFTPHIAAYTSGTISGKSSITIQLRHAPTHQVDSQALERLLSFSASLQGTVSWTDERTLTFTPKQALPSGKQFKAKFYLSRLQDVPTPLKTFTFQFQTLE